MKNKFKNLSKVTLLSRLIKKCQAVLNNNSFLFLAIFIIFFVSFVNIFPEKFTLNSGDAFQYLNFSKSFEEFNYLWMNNGEGVALSIFSYNLFYGFIYILSIFLNLSSQGQSFFYFFIFLFFSFGSFYIGLGLYEKNIEKKYKIFFSFLYSFNVYTLNSFLVGWPVFTPFLFLYLLIPILFGLTYNFFVLQKKINFKVISLLGLVFFLSNISNGSMPFFISLNIFIFLYLLFIFLFNRVMKNGYFFKKILIYYLVYFLAVFWSIVPQVSEMLRMSNVYANNESSFDISKWVLWQAVRFPNPFFFVFDINNYVNSTSFLTYLSLLVFLVLLLLIIFKKKQKDTLIINYLLLLVICIFLLNKGSGIFNSNIILNIFTGNPVLSSLRSADKILIFLPFFVLTLIFLNFEKLDKKKRTYILFILSVSLLCVYPFFVGGIQTKYSTSFQKGKDYLTAEYSSLNEIPDNYLKTASKLNLNKNEEKILKLPYSVINSVGWANYPKWKMVGTDPTVQFFNNPIIQMNSFNVFGKWNYGNIWNKQEGEESKWLLPFSGFLNIKYLIYHKDVREDFVRQTQSKIDYYEKNDLIKKIEDNEYFNVYELSEEYFLPHFYTPKNNIITDKKAEDSPEIVSGDDWEIRSAVFFEGQNEGKDEILKQVQNGKKEDLPMLEFRKINPTKYRIRVHNAEGQFPLIFSESFHDGWKAYVTRAELGPRSAGGDDKLDNYKVLDGNEGDQATKEEVEEFIEKGYVTELGDGEEKEIEHMKWNVEKQKEELDYIEKYNIDFISKNFQDTIQNDNLPKGKIWETWLAGKFKVQSSKLLSVFENNNIVELPEEDHLMVNGYANSWVIDVDEVCGGLDPRSAGGDDRVEAIEGKSLCIQNEDGTYDMELVVEFWPQRLFYIGLFISGTTLLACLGYLGYDFYRRKRVVSLEKGSKEEIKIDDGNKKKD